MKENVLVSILIQTYNRKELLKRALNCAINQTYKNIEIIIGDNASSDGTEEVCEEYAKKDNRIRYFRHKENLGIAKNGDFVLEKSEGKYVYYLNDDDWISENYIEEAIKVLENDESVIGVFGSVVLYKEDDKIKFQGCAQNIDSESYIERSVSYVEQTQKYCIATGLYRAEAFKKIQALKQYRFCEDQLFILKLAFLGKIIMLPHITNNKTGNGCTGDLLSIKENFNIPDMNEENYWYHIARAYMDSILFDELYQEKLSKNERIDFAIKIYHTIKNVLKQKKHKSFGQKIIDKIRGKE